MGKLEDYANEIPEEIRHAIRGLDSDYRTAIFIALYKHGELSFSELQKTLEMDKAMLNYHLGVLVESALVHHYYKHELGTEKYSFYNTTPFGQDFVEILSRFLRPLPYPVSFQGKDFTTSQVFSSGDWDIVSLNLPLTRSSARNLRHAMALLETCVRYRETRETITALDWTTTDNTNVFCTVGTPRSTEEQTIRPSTI